MGQGQPAPTWCHFLPQHNSSDHQNGHPHYGAMAKCSVITPGFFNLLSWDLRGYAFMQVKL